MILTHGDGDHIGFAERLRAEHGVPIYVHAADAHRAMTGEKPKTPMGSMRLGPALGFMAYGVRKNGLRSKYVHEVTEIADGDVLDLPGSPVIIGMPGHSPGSVAVHVPVANAVAVGDALTTRHVMTGRVGMQPAPFTDDPAQALVSLDRLAHLEELWILPGHGAPVARQSSRGHRCGSRHFAGVTARLRRFGGSSARGQPVVLAEARVLVLLVVPATVL